MLRTGFILFFALFLLGGCWFIPRCPLVHPHYGIDYNRVRDCQGKQLLKDGQVLFLLYFCDT